MNGKHRPMIGENRQMKLQMNQLKIQDFKENGPSFYLLQEFRE